MWFVQLDKSRWIYYNQIDLNTQTRLDSMIMSYVNVSEWWS